MIINHKEIFEKAVQEGRIVFDENDKPKCAICGKTLLIGNNLFVAVTPCLNCDESLKKTLMAEEQARSESGIAKRKQAINEAKKACFESERAFGQTFENDKLINGEASRKLQKNYIVNFDKYKAKGCGVLLYGGIGTGKTFLARAVLHALIEKGYKAKEVQIVRTYNAVCSNGEKKEAYLTELCRNDIVFIDDLGTERTSEGMSEFVYTLINTLYENKTPIICTTNISLSAFSNPDLDTNTGRVYSRILGSSIPLEINKVNVRNDDCKALLAEWEKNA